MLRKRSPAGGRALRLPLGALGGDALEQSGVVVLVDRQRHHHPGVDVAPGFTGLLLVQRHRDEGAEDEILDALPAASEQGAVAVGDRSQQDVVDLGVVGVGDRPWRRRGCCG